MYYYHLLHRSSTWQKIAKQIDDNFNITYQQFIKLHGTVSCFCGLFSSLTKLQEAFPDAKEGNYAYINNFTYPGDDAWAALTNATYDPSHTYYNIYAYDSASSLWKIIGVSDGSVTTGGGGASTDGGILENELRHNQSVGAIAKNHPGSYEAGTKVEDVLRDILFYAEPPTLTFTSTSVFVGSLVINLSITATLVPNNAGAPASLKVSSSDTTIKQATLTPTGSANRYTATYSPVIADGSTQYFPKGYSKTFTAVAVFGSSNDFAAGSNDLIKQAVATVTSKMPCYYGIIKDTEIQASNITLDQLKTGSTVASISGREWTASGYRTVFIAVPSDSATPKLVDATTKVDVIPTLTPATKTYTLGTTQYSYKVWCVTAKSSTNSTFIVTI